MRGMSDVEDGEVGQRPLEALPGREAVGEALDAVPLAAQGEAHGLAQALLVVHQGDQTAGRRGRHRKNLAQIPGPAPVSTIPPQSCGIPPPLRPRRSPPARSDPLELSRRETTHVRDGTRTRKETVARFDRSQDGSPGWAGDPVADPPGDGGLADRRAAAAAERGGHGGREPWGKPRSSAGQCSPSPRHKTWGVLTCPHPSRDAADRRLGPSRTA